MSSIKYYNPSPKFIKYLQEQLHSKEERNSDQMAGDKGSITHKTNKKDRGRIATKKSRYLDHVFQAFADILYFLEFIEQNYDKLHDTFDDDLKQLFGYFDDRDPNKGGRKASGRDNIDIHHSNPPLKRFVDALLLLNTNVHTNPTDFRTFLLVILIDKSLQALYDRYSGDEKYFISDDCRRVRFWAKYLESQSRDVAGLSNKRIAYGPYLPRSHRFYTIDNSNQ
jgi:hypothetical protein